MPRRSLALLLCLVFLFSNSFAGPVACDISQRTPKNAALRSLILPGWGQYFNEQRDKGYVIGGAAILTFAGSYFLYTKANNTYDDYEKAGIRNGPLYSDYETQSNQAMAVSFLCAGIWIYAVIDAYVFGNGELTQSRGRAGFNFACNQYQTGVSYSKKF
jgi:hypothetical protein